MCTLHCRPGTHQHQPAAKEFTVKSDSSPGKATPSSLKVGVAHAQSLSIAQRTQVRTIAQKTAGGARDLFQVVQELMIFHFGTAKRKCDRKKFCLSVAGQVLVDLTDVMKSLDPGPPPRTPQNTAITHMVLQSTD